MREAVNGSGAGGALDRRRHMFLFCSQAGTTAVPRRRRNDTISEYHLDQIDRQITLLRVALDEATRSLTPFRPHYDAIGDLQEHLHRAMNVLNNRPPEYRKPHGAM
jgi:hypothetical protein